MDVTSKLVRLFQVEKQIRGLRSRLDSAERFLAEQTRELAALDAKRSTVENQVKSLAVTASDSEGEMKRLDARIASIREQMNTAQTNKQYQAFLVEVNNFKTDRDKAETAALEAMAKVEEARKQLEELQKAREQRDQVRKVAAAERDTRHQEIQTRLNELEGQRQGLAQTVPPEAMTMLTMLLKSRGEEAMAPVQVHDRKRHEYTCGACQMSIPIEAVSALLSKGSLTKCVSCQCILFLDEEATRALQPPAARSAKR